MSGGSYNYLCYTVEQDFLRYGVISELKRMADRLTGLGYAPEAAERTKRLVQTLEFCLAEACQAKNELEDVWKAVEWWDSADWGEDDVKEAIEKSNSKAQAASLPEAGEHNTDTAS
jgi:hypothetical protein